MIDMKIPMELVRACTKERLTTGVDTRRAKGKSKAKDHVDKDRGKGQKLHMAKRTAQNRECWSDSIMALLVQ